jgi:hypothetical protein
VFSSSRERERVERCLREGVENDLRERRERRSLSFLGCFFFLSL